ncbi:RidA family protein [Agrobacterium pusense]|uniref:RidA family protein n=1 Tax=Agrobacterium pusense TaxID=648995 RepID=UPI001C6F57A9|nr:Rid family hydrolase [Agrobacterium pusense]MBW9061592.1 RidA family protein [Agrobacterium pusense]
MTNKANTPRVESANHSVAWEKAFGYAQAVKVKDTIYVSGQLSHDSQGNLVAPAEIDATGKPVSFDTMEAQIRQTYENARVLLQQFGATFDDVVEETLYVLDVDAAFGPASEIRKKVYGSELPQLASNIIGVTRLAFPQQLVEITFRAVVDR